MVKVRIGVTSTRATNFRMMEQWLCHGWLALKELLATHGNLRGVDARIGLAPELVSKVNGRVKITRKLGEIDLEPPEASTTNDFPEQMHCHAARPRASGTIL